MHLVDEQHRGALELARLLDRLADILDPGQHRGQRYKKCIGILGDQARNGRLAGARRPPENHRVQLASLDRLP
jgi:hypothetical protein